MKKQKEPFHPKVIHTMADGSVRDSVDGYYVPVNETTKVAYQMLVTMARRYCEDSAKEQPDETVKKI